MKQTVLHLLGFVTAALFALGAAPAFADAAGPYYATPSWDQTLPASTRFVVLSNFASAAVLDRETGLIWERSPSATEQIGVPLPGVFGGDYAASHCNNLTVGNRMGWRLPTVQELLTLVDPSQSGLKLPAGHPFINVQSAYWTSTTYVVTNLGQALAFWTVHFSIGAAGAAGATGGVFTFPV